MNQKVGNSLSLSFPSSLSVTHKQVLCWPPRAAMPREYHPLASIAPRCGLTHLWRLEVVGQRVSKVGSCWGTGGRTCPSSQWVAGPSGHSSACGHTLIPALAFV